MTRRYKIKLPSRLRYRFEAGAIYSAQTALLSGSAEAVAYTAHLPSGVGAASAAFCTIVAYALFRATQPVSYKILHDKRPKFASETLASEPGMQTAHTVLTDYILDAAEALKINPPTLTIGILNSAVGRTYHEDDETNAAACGSRHHSSIELGSELVKLGMDHCKNILSHELSHIYYQDCDHSFADHAYRYGYRGAALLIAGANYISQQSLPQALWISAAALTVGSLTSGAKTALSAALLRRTEHEADKFGYVLSNHFKIKIPFLSSIDATVPECLYEQTSHSSHPERQNRLNAIAAFARSHP